MQKSLVIDSFVSFFEKKIQAITEGLEGTRRMAREAPSSNVSHSDTSKHQLSELALGIDIVLYDYQVALRYLQTLSRSAVTVVTAGALFTLYDAGSDQSSYYLLVVNGGGESIVIDDFEITTLSYDSHLAKLCLGKRVGEVIVLNRRVIRVAKVL